MSTRYTTRKSAGALGFRPRYSKDHDTRLDQCWRFYQDLQALYREVLVRGIVKEPVRVFRDRYAPTANELPETKIIDFILWSAGKFLGETERAS